MAAKMALGPILYAGRSDERAWRFFVNVLIERGSSGAPPIRVTTDAEGAAVSEPVIAADFGKAGPFVSWHWEVTVPRGETERRIGYAISPAGSEKVTGLSSKKTFEGIAIPARGSLPRIGFFSCNGVDDPKLLSRVADQDGLWKKLLRLHERGAGDPGKRSITSGPFHLLIGGGDQVYADSLWVAPPLSKYGDGPRGISPKKRMTDSDQIKLLGAYIELYTKRWSRTEPARAFSKIPVFPSFLSLRHDLIFLAVPTWCNAPKKGG